MVVVKMGSNIVEQQHRRPAPRSSSLAAASKQGDHQRLLLAGRAQLGRHAAWAVHHGKIGLVRARCGAAGFGIAWARGFQRCAEPLSSASTAGISPIQSPGSPSSARSAAGNGSDAVLQTRGSAGRRGHGVRGHAIPVSAMVSSRAESQAGSRRPSLSRRAALTPWHRS